MENKKLYFVSENVKSGELSLSLMKMIRIYEIVDSKLDLLFTVETDNSIEDELAITNYLDDNGYGDEMFDLVSL